LQKLKAAIPEHNEHVIALQDFENSLDERPETLTEWRSEIIAWERDNTKPNPFQSRVKSEVTCSISLRPFSDTFTALSQKDVHLALAEQEAREPPSISHQDVSPSAWVTTGIELEDQQFVFCYVI
jgi:hypothetical protein